MSQLTGQRVPASVSTWYRILRSEGVGSSSAALRAIDRAFSEGSITEAMADALEKCVRAAGNEGSGLDRVVSN
jgi:hypothetical protein